MSKSMPPEILKAQALLDSESASWPDDTRKAWIAYRAHARRTERISSTALPAMGGAAQEMVLARDHAHRAIDLMSGVFGQPEEDAPDTKRHKKVPDDGT